jgi:hypothetical protein
MVSDTYVRIIPTDPKFVPSALARERALSVLQHAAPFADDIASHLTDEVRFIDAGADFETVCCPRCGADIAEWWSLAMEVAHEQRFRHLRITTPCCGAHTSLNELVYTVPAGFARYTLEALNPGLQIVPDSLIRRLEHALGTSIHVIWAHY